MKIKDKQKIFEEIKNKYLGVFGDKIDSIYIYGSAITNNFDPKTSDINVAIILDDLKLKTLIQSEDVVKRLRKKRVIAPLFLSKSYIDSSLDTFPIEFLEIKSNHKTIYGEDYFNQLVIEKDYLRLQAERELKGKLLLLRLTFIENMDKTKRIGRIVRDSISSIIPVLKAILVLKDKKLPAMIDLLINETGNLLKINMSSIRQALKYKDSKFKLKGDELINFFQEYIQTVDKLSDKVDKF